LNRRGRFAGHHYPLSGTEYPFADGVADTGGESVLVPVEMPGVKKVSGESVEL
jgi:hypothetical protein